mgnify:CR=1 FL=1
MKTGIGSIVAAVCFATSITAGFAIGASDTNAASKTPTLGTPDESVVLPDSAKKEAEVTFAKGFSYFIWPVEQEPIKRGDSNVLLIPFFYIANSIPVPYTCACTVLGDFQVLKPDGITYSARGRGLAMHIDFMMALHGKGKAVVHLVDFETTGKQISNDMTIDVEL